VDPELQGVSALPSGNLNLAVNIINMQFLSLIPVSYVPLYKDNVPVS
jgi:hypothetical protein